MSITDIHPLRAWDLLREARRIAGLSRPRLSEASGTHANQIAHIEKTHGAGWATMVSLLDACGFEVTVRENTLRGEAKLFKPRAFYVIEGEASHV